jgi:hypothetical protein
MPTGDISTFRPASFTGIVQTHESKAEMEVVRDEFTSL